MLCSNTAHYVFPIYVINKKTPEGVYAGRVGVSKNSWRQMALESWAKHQQQMCAGETEIFC